TATFLINAFNYMNTATDAGIGDPLDNNKLIQQYLWFSANWPAFDNSNLVSSTNPKTLTVVGDAYKTAAQAMPQTINLLAVHTAPGPQAQAGGLTTITVLVGVMDNGSIAPSGGTNVTVYADPARTQVLGTGVLKGARGCGRRE